MFFITSILFQLTRTEMKATKTGNVSPFLKNQIYRTLIQNTHTHTQIVVESVVSPWITAFSPANKVTNIYISGHLSVVSFSNYLIPSTFAAKCSLSSLVSCSCAPVASCCFSRLPLAELSYSFRPGLIHCYCCSPC